MSFFHTEIVSGTFLFSGIPIFSTF